MIKVSQRSIKNRGNLMGQDWREPLFRIIDSDCLITSAQFTLSKGQTAGFYFDCKKATLDGFALGLIADAFIHEIGKLHEEPEVISGLTMGADPIVAAVVMRAAELGKRTTRASIVRKEAKKHGTMNYIENEQPPGSTVVVVDDVITSGSSTKTACDQLLASGYRIVGIVSLIDRQAGGVQDLEQEYNCPVLSIFKRDDFEEIAIDSAAAKTA